MEVSLPKPSGLILIRRIAVTSFQPTNETKQSIFLAVWLLLVLEQIFAVNFAAQGCANPNTWLRLA